MAAKNAACTFVTDRKLKHMIYIDLITNMKRGENKGKVTNTQKKSFWV